MSPSKMPLKPDIYVLQFLLLYLLPHPTENLLLHPFRNVVTSITLHTTIAF